MWLEFFLAFLFASALWLLVPLAAMGADFEQLSKEAVRKTDAALASEIAEMLDATSALRILEPIFRLDASVVEEIRRLTRDLEAINADRAARRRTLQQYLRTRPNQPASMEVVE